MVINLTIVTGKVREWRDRATPYVLVGGQRQGGQHLDLP
jgi:hypothetical protein